MDKWDFTKPTELPEIIELLERRIVVHNNWLNYLKENSDSAQLSTKYGVGTVESHTTYIKQYESAIEILRKML